jgi:hypothetical protein
MPLNSQGCMISAGAVTPHSRQKCSAFAASSSSTALAKAQDFIIEGSAGHQLALENETAVATAGPPRFDYAQGGFAYQVRATLAQQSQSN